MKKIYKNGKEHPRAILTREQVKEIRFIAKEKSMTRKKLARVYGINKAHLSRVINKKNWKNI